MRKVYLLVFIAFLSYQAGAQSFIKFTSHGFAQTVPTDSGQVIFLNDSVYNTSSVPFADTLFFYGRVNFDTTIRFFGPVGYSANTLDSNGSPITAKACNIPIPLSTPGFVSGPNGVVIWPLYAGGSAGPNDTIRAVITISHIAGLDEAPLAKMYIIQRRGNLNIQFGDYRDLIEQVSLYDISGRRLYSGSAQQSQNIPTGGWSEGVYFCEITTYHGERRIIKFVLQ